MMRYWKRFGCFFAAVTMFLAADTPAGPPVMLADIGAGRTPAASSSPMALVRVGSRVFFYAQDLEHGYELWVTDGTPDGTRLVKDINPGPEGSAVTIDETAVFEDRVLTGWTRWRWGDEWGYWDQVRPFPYQRLVATDAGVVYFFAHRPTTGAELWRSDGTEGGTSLVKDIWPGRRSATLGAIQIDNHFEAQIPLVAIGNSVYFTANDGAGGPVLWTSDGTDAGTRVCARLNFDQTKFSGPHSLAAVNGKLFFAATDGVRGYEPWLYNPPTGTARQLGELNPDRPENGLRYQRILYGNGITTPHSPLVVGSRVYFFGTFNNYNVSRGAEHLFVYDEALDSLDVAGGLTESTDPVDPRVDTAFDPVAVGGKVLFSANARFGVPSIFVHDPAAPLPNSSPLAPSAKWPRRSVSAGGVAFFVAFKDGEGWELWRTDATPPGSFRVRDLNPGRNSGAAIALPGYIAAIERLQDRFARPLPLFAHNGWCYAPGTPVGESEETPVGSSTSPFAVPDGQSVELYRTDGTSGSLNAVADLNPGTPSSTPANLTPLDPTRFLFTAETAATGRELWISDGTPAGTRLVRDIATGTAGSEPDQFTAVPNRGVFFTARDGQSGRELWSVDPSQSVGRVSDVRPGAADSLPSYLTAVGETLFFAADDGSSGYELHATDGTAAGTRLTRDLRPGPANGLPLLDARGLPIRCSPFAAVNEKLVFTGDDGVTGQELYHSDGTATGTRRLRDVFLGPITGLGWTDRLFRLSGTGFRDGIPANMAPAASVVYFSAMDGVTTSVPAENPAFNQNGNPNYVGGGAELYRTDGTPTGTRLAADINTLAPSDVALGSGPVNITALENAALPAGSVVFYAHEGWINSDPQTSPGRELYVYDAGTGQASLLRDINPSPVGWEVGSGSSYVDRPMGVLSGVAYLAADDGASGVELWRTDGTPAGTAMVADLNPGPGSSDPGPFAVLPGRVVFQAADSASGEYRLYAYAAGDPAPVLLSEHVHAVRAAGDVPTIAAWGGRVYFAGSSARDNKGLELYSTDGTPGSVRLEADLNPGPAGSSPRHLAGTGYGLFFSATDGVRGLEPWAIRPGARPCRADFDGSGAAAVPDIFAFLASWFASEPRADFDASGSVAVPDIFAFLSAWFAGCG